jgi:hypothetical protein
MVLLPHELCDMMVVVVHGEGGRKGGREGGRKRKRGGGVWKGGRDRKEEVDRVRAVVQTCACMHAHVCARTYAHRPVCATCPVGHGPDSKRKVSPLSQAVKEGALASIRLSQDGNPDPAPYHLCPLTCKDARRQLCTRPCFA